jgi:oxygen-dependent protoporphyrinogen oxidase
VQIAIIGAGVAGLTTAFALRREAARRANDIGVTVLEASPRPGGRIRTTDDGGYRIEWAANGIQGTDGAAWRLAEAAGLGEERVMARPDAARRYIFHRGRLHLLPTDPLSLLRFGALSLGGKLRAAAEPIFARRIAREESVHDFAARHIGEEAARVLIGAVARGIFAGDATRLSVDAAFPLMRAMEREHRSLILAMVRPRKRRGAAGGRGGGPMGRALWTLRGGLQSLTDALAGGAAVRVNAAALAIARHEPRGYSIRLASGEHLQADAVVLAVPARAAAALLRDLDAELARRIGAIEAAGIAVAALAFRPEAFRKPPDGYGYLVAPGEDLDVLGALFESNLFPDRAPEGRILARVMVGGVDHPELLTRSDAVLVALAMKALDRTHGLTSGPERTWVVRQEAAIPQYAVGHAALVADLDRRTAAHPGLHLIGSPYRGVSLASLIEDAERTAARALVALNA